MARSAFSVACPSGGEDYIRHEEEEEEDGNEWLAVSLGNCSKHFECRTVQEQHNTIAQGSVGESPENREMMWEVEG